MSGGLHNDMAVHDFDMARFLVGSEVAEVYCKGSCKVGGGERQEMKINETQERKLVDVVDVVAVVELS